MQDADLGVFALIGRYFGLNDAWSGRFKLQKEQFPTGD